MAFPSRSRSAAPGVPAASPRTTPSSDASRHSIDANVGPVATAVHGSGSVVVVEAGGCVVVAPPSDVVVTVLAVTVLLVVGADVAVTVEVLDVDVVPPGCVVLVVVLVVEPGCVLEVVLAPGCVVLVVVVA
jgi:hypothetical protein